MCLIKHKVNVLNKVTASSEMQETSFIIGCQPSCVVLSQGGADMLVILGCEQTCPLLQRVVHYTNILDRRVWNRGQFVLLLVKTDMQK